MKTDGDCVALAGREYIQMIKTEERFTEKYTSSEATELKPTKALYGPFEKDFTRE